jgi:hypothetical protein
MSAENRTNRLNRTDRLNRLTGWFGSIGLVWLTALAGSASAEPVRTLRVDYYHTGGLGNAETFALDRAVVEPAPWPGNPAKTIDDTNLGRYFFEVVDTATNRVVYSRGFSSIFGEWETTDDARKQARTFQESLRFPKPEHPVQVIVKKRDPANLFREVWMTVVDPRDQFVDTAAPVSPGPVIELLKNGDPATKVDLLILGDGYTAAEQPKFRKDAERLVETLFDTEPFKSRKADFNVWGLCPPAAESGISRPSTGVHRRSPIGASYDTFGSERYVLTFDNRAFRDAASYAPYDVAEILVNGKTYGGGGIYGLYATVAADSLWAPYVFVHEFGHHFAGLADEYYTSDVAYLPSANRLEPWEPNVTAMKDPANLKWKALATADVPLPTPWVKDAYEAHSKDIQQRRRAIRAANKPEADMDALFTQQKAEEMRMLGHDRYSTAVGAFEGANYEAKGYYRPQEDCIMFTRDDVPFCRVCQWAIARVIDLYSK